MSISSRMISLLAAVVILAAALVYLNSLGGEFVFDDRALVAENLLIRSPANVPRVLGLTGEKPPQRPVRHLSYMIDYQVSGLRPWGYHAFNIFYHALASLAVFFVALRLLGRERVLPAFAAALIFAVHPVHTDAVSYISGRRDVLSTLFYFLGILFFLRFRRLGSLHSIVLAYGMYLLAVSSKEMAITLPAVFLLYDWSVEVKPGTGRDVFPALARAAWKGRRLHLVFFGTAALLALYTVLVEKASYQQVYYGESVILNFLTVARVIVYYIYLLVFPLKLSVLYSYNAFPLTLSVLDPGAWLAAAFLLVLAGGSIWLLARSRWAGFAGIWFFITLLPVSHIIPHHDFMAEHYLYLPSFAFCLLAGLVLERLAQVEKLKIAAYAGLAVLVFGYSARTVVRNRDWKDPVTLWKKTSETFPECARAHENLGRVYNLEGRYDLAIGSFQRALEINPRLAFPRLGLGNAYLAKGVTGRAREEFLAAVRLYREYLDQEPDLATARMHLGAAYARLGMLDEAEKEFIEVLELEPANADMYFFLGEIAWKRGEKERAISFYRQAREYNPEDVAAREALGILLGEKGMTGQAITEFRAIIALRPSYAGAYYNLGLAFFRSGKCPEGVSQWEKGAEVDSDRARAEEFLGRTEEAERECREKSDG